MIWGISFPHKTLKIDFKFTTPGHTFFTILKVFQAMYLDIFDLVCTSTLCNLHMLGWIKKWKYHLELVGSENSSA